MPIRAALSERRVRYRRPNLWFAFLLPFCCGSVAKPLVETASSAPEVVWKAKMFREIPAEKSQVDGESVRLRLVPTGIRCEFKSGNDFEIPFSGVVEIAHDVTKRNRGAIILQYFREHLDAYTCSHDCTVAIMLVPVFAPFTRQRHYVALGWSEDSKTKRVVFRLDKQDYRAFLEQISVASGQPVWDIARERENQRRALKQQLKGAITVHLKHEVVLGDVVLKRRGYKLCFVDRNAGEGEVTFFDAYEPVLTAPVDVISGGSVASGEVAYEQAPGGAWTITEIRIREKVLCFRNSETSTPQD